MADFIVDSPVKADWALEKIREHYANIKVFKAKRDALISEYQSRIDAAKEIYEQDCDADSRAIEHLKDLLLEYASENMPKGKRTIKLPQGNLSFRARPQKFYLDDNSEPSANNQHLIDLVEFFGGNDEFLQSKTVKSIDWTAYKKTLTVDDEGKIFDQNGVEVPFLNVEIANDKFVVKFGDDMV